MPLVPILTAIGQCCVIILLADFTGGLFHWAEDTLGDEATPIWGPLFVRPNMRHHDDPTHILTVPWLRGARFIFLAAATILAIAVAFHALTWQLLLFLALAAFNDQAHRLEHMPTARLPRMVTLLRRMHILQTARQHWQHHRPPHISAYCVLTPWLNPVLDGSRFWRGMERVFVPFCTAPRRPDLAHLERKKRT